MMLLKILESPFLSLQIRKAYIPCPHHRVLYEFFLCEFGTDLFEQNKNRVTLKYLCHTHFVTHIALLCELDLADSKYQILLHVVCIANASLTNISSKPDNVIL